MRANLQSLALLAGIGLVSAVSPAAAQDGLAAAKEFLAPYSAKPVFTPPGEPFDAKACAAGKKMLSIPKFQRQPLP